MSTLALRLLTNVLSFLLVKITGEGVMVGTGSFLQLSIGTILATAGCLWALKVFPPTYGLTGVWIGFGVFNLIRLIGVWIHQYFYGPLATRSMDKEDT